MAHIVGPLGKVTAYRMLADKGLGLPRRGIHVGGGIHVDLNAPERPGWTLHGDDIREHPTAKPARYSTMAFPPAALHGLSTAEAAQSAHDYDEAEELGKDWEPVEAAPRVAPKEVDR